MTTPTPTPAALAIENEGTLCISWSNGQVRRYSVRNLRDRCPCATCRETHGATTTPNLLPVLRIEETRPLRIVAMKPVGNYAYGIHFSDGHDTGIYTLDYLWNWDAEEPESTT